MRVTEVIRDIWALLWRLAVHAALLALVSWVCGLIILPEMGLRAPGYLTWVAVNFIALLVYAARAVAQGLHDA